MKYVFVDESWEDYLFWQSTDKKILRRINELLKDISRTPYSGIGKPEPLRHNYKPRLCIRKIKRLIFLFDEIKQTI
jgi:Txe/YoeB family toxin of toxin-antitoxin system